MLRTIALSIILAGTLAGSPLATATNARAGVTYDIVYVRQPRHGDATHAIWPEVFHPGTFEPGSDLVLLRANGSEEVLVDTLNGAVTDPFVSFDAQWVYYSFSPDVRLSASNTQRGNLPLAGADIYRINLATRVIQRLTHQEFTPNTGSGNWLESNPVDPPDTFNRLGYGILNLGPAPLAGGKIIFSSNRNGLLPVKSYTFPVMQLFVMDEDGANVTPVAPMTHGSALHPTPLADGRVMFTSHEAQGLRDERMWGVWSILPDGRYFEPLISAFSFRDALHFYTQLGNGDIVVEDYYNLNNWGFGTLYKFPLPAPGAIRFHSADLSQGPGLTQTASAGYTWHIEMPFAPRGIVGLTPFTTAGDDSAPVGVGGVRVGKFTHPSAAPGNDLLVAWSPGPANTLNRPVNTPALDSGIYVIPGGNPIGSPSALTLIKSDPNFNEAWPRAVVPYSAVHGVAEPAKPSWLPNDGSAHPLLPAGTPYGLVGTSSFYKRETTPGFANTQAFDGLDQFNTAENEFNSNWFWQGADAGKYANSDIWAVRILAMEPNAHRSYGPADGQQFFNHGNERLRILGEIPLRKTGPGGQPVLDSEGNPDTSFLAKLPADTTFTFQALDRNGMVLNMAQTWHQVRPGEMRADCGGCHAHSQQPLAFQGTAASQPGYSIPDLSKFTPLLTQDGDGNPATRTVSAGVVNVEFVRDIRPLLERSCTSCHTKNVSSPPGNLVLDDLTGVPGPNYTTLPGDFARLCFDRDANHGYPPLVKFGSDPLWRGTNASRYVRPFQSRRSMLMWKVFGQRLDGWVNADHPTETTPGDSATLPGGAANVNVADLDYTGTIMPPPGSSVPVLSADDKMNFARWIDLGCPIDTAFGTAAGAFGWMQDDLRPTLEVSLPRPGLNDGALNRIRVGVADAYTGIASGTLSITSSVAINGRSPGAQLADLAVSVDDGVYVISISPPITSVRNAHVYASVRDVQGNVTRVDRSYSIGAVIVNLNRRVFLPLSRRP